MTDLTNTLQPELDSSIVQNLVTPTETLPREETMMLLS
jgi:hypothetical protein